jgi:hypothetical protein
MTLTLTEKGVTPRRNLDLSIGAVRDSHSTSRFVLSREMRRKFVVDLLPMQSIKKSLKRALLGKYGNSTS